ncbi:hypothetical protein M758_9G012900 [Ceratodon purpureus]|uniref:Uncharacterized protein n=1 Tax=Ceratodon purpureus TaxID=3225 RepID=A0A8T0GSZ9_CERPU|nr:hypothetical protein KC19_9G013300 [Ceratodon purpureus]KAG0604847.1 hypothetical protein M758_9G012900 [Ceratodon purpureus]
MLAPSWAAPPNQIALSNWIEICNKLVLVKQQQHHRLSQVAFKDAAAVAIGQENDSRFLAMSP